MSSLVIQILWKTDWTQ